MRTAQEVLAEWDEPEGTAGTFTSGAKSVRQRIEIEVYLDLRDQLVELVSVLGECKDELIEIKGNTA